MIVLLTMKELEDQKKNPWGSKVGHLCITRNRTLRPICSCAISSPRYLSTRPISFDGDTECVGNYLWK
jgi:hypothetical protein